MAARVVCQLAAAVKPAAAVNPVHYAAMRRFFEMDKEDSTFTGLVWNARITNVEERKLSAEFLVTKSKIQHFGTLHGGCTATMIDCLTCAAVIVATGRAAVTVNLALSCMAPAKLGTLVRIDAKVTRVGKSLVYTTANLVRADNGIEIASANHIMAFHNKAYVREMDDREFNFR